MTGRAIPEWRGSTPDAKIPDRVKRRIWLRCDGRCALTGRKLRPGDQHDFDHIQPLEDDGVHAEMNLQLVWRPAHREKSKAEATGRAKERRIFAKHTGIKTPGRKLRGPGFRGWQKMDGTAVWRGRP